MSLWNTLGGTPRRQLISAGATLSVIALCSLYLAAGGGRRGTLHIVNGLDVGVVVEIEGSTVAIEPQAHSLQVLPNGPHLATTKTHDGRVLERAVVVADSRSSAVVYNVLGAAPIVEAKLHYSVAGRAGDRKPDVTFHGGHRLAVIDDVDYVFTEAPKTISAERSSGEIVKRVLLDAKGGAATTVSFLLREGRGAEAVELERALFGADPSSLKTLNYASEAAFAAYGNDDAVVAMVAPIVSRSPSSAEDVTARYLVSEGCRYACDDVMHIVSNEGPGKRTPSRKLTMTRGQDEPAVRRALAELAAESPSDANVIRLQAWFALLDGKWKDCADLFEKVSKQPLAEFDIEERATCLHAGGHHAEALELAASAAAAKNDGAWQAAIIYGRIAAAGKEVPGTYLDKLEEDPGARAAAKALWLGVIDRNATKPESGTPLADGLAVVVAASQSADAGIELAKKKPSALRHAPDALAIMLGGELARRGDIVAAERVLAAARSLRLPAKAVIDYVLRGTIHPLTYRIDPEQRAALDFIRARRLESLGQPSQLAYAAARKRDLLNGWVHRLIEAWEKPEVKNEVLVYAAAPE